MERNLFKLSNGELINVSMQQTGTLKNGQTVTGYYNLLDSILIAEGWKPLVIDTPPEQVEGINYESYFEETATAIFKHYKTVPAEV